VGARDGAPFACSAATFDRRANPARGRQGGQPGAPGRVEVQAPDGALSVYEGKGTIEVPAGGLLCVDLPGGGGWGEAQPG
jgi:N-methylhydantoinase B